MRFIGTRIALIDGTTYEAETGEEQTGLIHVWLCHVQLEEKFSSRDISRGDEVGVKRLPDQPEVNAKQFYVEVDKADRSETGGESDDRIADGPTTESAGL
jgi:hypothetical protein